MTSSSLPGHYLHEPMQMRPCAKQPIGMKNRASAYTFFHFRSLVLRNLHSHVSDEIWNGNRNHYADVGLIHAWTERFEIYQDILLFAYCLLEVLCYCGTADRILVTQVLYFAANKAHIFKCSHMFYHCKYIAPSVFVIYSTWKVTVADSTIFPLVKNLLWINVVAL